MRLYSGRGSFLVRYKCIRLPPRYFSSIKLSLGIIGHEKHLSLEVMKEIILQSFLYHNWNYRNIKGHAKPSS